MRTIQKQFKIGRNDPCPCGATGINDLPQKYKHCCLKESKSKKFITSNEKYITYLKTLPKEMSCKESCLNFLFRILDVLTTKDFIRELAFIGKSLDVVDIFGAHEKLVQKYASQAMQEDLAKDFTNSGIFLLFNRYALRLIDELLRVRISDRNVLLNDSKTKSVIEDINLHEEIVENNLKTIEGIFLLANTLITEIENETFFQNIENDEKAKIFLSRRTSHKPSAIGRSRIYRYGDFPLKLQKIDIEVEEYFKTAFALCSHIESHPVAELEIPGSFKQLTSCLDFLEKYISLLTGKVKEACLPERSSLAKLYYTDQLCRQHPLIQIDNRYFCLQPDLLWATLKDLPFYLLLDSCKKNKKEGDALWQFYGDIFEKNWRDLSIRVFGIEKCEDYECKNKHPDLNLLEKQHRIGDCFVSLNQDIKVIFEFKGATPEDSIKMGSKNKLLSKFIYLEDGAGISQLCTDATVYRREMSFNGLVYIVLAVRGPLPLTSAFDLEVESYLNKHVDYQNYLLNKQNQPVIWIDENCLELIFSGLHQGLSQEDAFQKLAGALPSKIPQLIFEMTQRNHLNFSSADLYREEIRAQVESCQTMFYNRT